MKYPVVPRNSLGLLTSYLQDRRSRNLSPETIRYYSGYLNTYLKWIRCPALEATKGDIMAFLESRTCAPGGKHAYFRAIRAFYNWIKMRNLWAARQWQICRAYVPTTVNRWTAGGMVINESYHFHTLNMKSRHETKYGTFMGMKSL